MKFAPCWASLIGPAFWDLIDACFKGDAKTALNLFRDQYDAGAEPGVILRDLLDLVHLLTRVKAAGPSAAGHGPAGEADASRAKTLADALEMNALTRAWSLLMKGLAETSAAPDPAAAGEMALIRLSFASDLPTPDEALRALKKNTSGGSQNGSLTRSVPENNAPRAEQNAPPTELPQQEPPSKQQAPTGAPWLQNFNDVVRLAGERRDAKLRTELESYVHLVDFSQGRIELRLHENAPSDLAGRLTQRLKEWTGRQWIVTVNTQAEGAATVRDARMAEVLAHPIVQKTMEVFPGAEVTAIREREVTVAPVEDDDDDKPVDPDDDFPDLGSLEQKPGKA